ncbi:hypothetical protein LB504_001645 [Fusarium proliferatum]|nr:hypothetical protein LB504_001645 [Fusarium proliferatum]
MMIRKIRSDSPRNASSWLPLVPCHCPRHNLKQVESLLAKTVTKALSIRMSF